jgi:ABC-type lipoprotein export system ATPase subunit
MVDNNAETLQFLQENMGAVIQNVKMVKRLEALDNRSPAQECRKYDGIPQELAKQIFACGLNND